MYTMLRRVTAVVMAVVWGLLAVLSWRWLPGSLADCPPGSDGGCSKFDVFSYVTYYGAIAVAIAGVALAVHVWAGRDGAAITGAVLHLLAPCLLVLPATGLAPVSDAAQVVWCWVFIVAHVALAVALVALVVFPGRAESSTAVVLPRQRCLEATGYGSVYMVDVDEAEVIAIDEAISVGIRLALRNNRAENPPADGGREVCLTEYIDPASGQIRYAVEQLDGTRQAAWDFRVRSEAEAWYAAAAADLELT